MSDAVLTTKATYFLPGSFFPEESTVALESRSIEEAVAKAPRNAFCFTLADYAQVPESFDSEQFKVLPKPQNKSGRIYIGGEVFTVPELKAWAERQPTDHSVLIGNVEGNGYSRAIRCRTGNWQPLEDSDQVLPAPQEGKGK